MRRSIQVAGMGVLFLLAALFAKGNVFAVGMPMAEENDSKPVAYMSVGEMFSNRKVRALAQAAARGNIGRVDRLVEEGVDVNFRGNSNVTPLFWAMQNATGFRRLLEHGADPNVVFDDGGSVMHWAVRAEDIEILRLALEYGGDPNLVGGEDGITPIFRALTHRSSIEVLLESGADIDAQKRGWVMRDKRIGGGVTPVMAAVDLAQFDTVLFLLEHGADYSIESDRGDTLVDLLAGYRDAFKAGSHTQKLYDEVVEWLCERGIQVPK